jgi:hypothetical protein
MLTPVSYSCGIFCQVISVRAGFSPPRKLAVYIRWAALLQREPPNYGKSTMTFNRLVDILPLGIIYLLTVAIVYLSILAGILLARFWRIHAREEKEEAVNTAVGAVLALLAFILAFTFSLTASRFDSRKQLLLDEVNAIGTVFLRAGLIPEPQRTEVRRLLKSYVDIRVNLTKHPETVLQAIKQSEELQDQMWTHAEALAQLDLKNPDIVSLFVDSLNEMIDLQTSRVVVALIYRIPNLMWYALLGITVIAMTSVGYLFGKSAKINWPLILLLAFAFSVVIALIADLDRMGGGLIKINQQPMFDLQKKIHEQME